MKSVKEDKQILLVFAIDISGSMENNFLNPFKWDRTKDAFKSFINNQQKSHPSAIVDIFTFNSDVNALYKKAPISKINNFLNDIKPNGGTSLNDSIIAMNHKMEKNIKTMRVFEIILTDGEDTSSESSSTTVRERITKLQKDGVEFIFLGAGIDSFKTASNYGISYSTNVSLDDNNSHDNIGNVTKSLSDNIDKLVRTNSTIANCPELLRAYSEPYYRSSDNQKNKRKFIDIPTFKRFIPLSPPAQICIPLSSPAQIYIPLSPPAQICIQQPARRFSGYPLTCLDKVTRYEETSETDKIGKIDETIFSQSKVDINLFGTTKDLRINIPPLTRN
jgi:uncharacterized protein YegL